ncbi:hypothetical protein F0562_019447 [Nyssa sinensis]|uniref:Uncharacterized protein n=1 Tax=Nyssa sinensis TaxID=561372 RepID=A0A5J5BPU2_9ASTE|nr:hypothetical protein F0562_019447 [Nyssa sinensis]
MCAAVSSTDTIISAESVRFPRHFSNEDKRKRKRPKFNDELAERYRRLLQPADRPHDEVLSPRNLMAANLTKDEASAYKKNVLAGFVPSSKAKKSVPSSSTAAPSAQKRRRNARRDPFVQDLTYSNLARRGPWFRSEDLSVGDLTYSALARRGLWRRSEDLSIGDLTYSALARRGLWRRSEDLSTGDLTYSALARKGPWRRSEDLSTRDLTYSALARRGLWRRWSVLSMASQDPLKYYTIRIKYTV